MIKNIKSKTELSGFYVIFNNTLVNENLGKYGISHFIEHLICKSIEPLLEDLEKNGIDWNAYTSTEQLNFYITGLDKYVNEYKNRFLDCILNFNINEERFEIEKNVLIKEYIDTFSSRHNKHFYNVYRKYYDFYHVIGRLDDIKNLKYEDCVNHYKEYYTKPNQIFNVSKKYKFIENIDFSKEKKKTLEINKSVNLNNIDVEYYYNDLSYNNISIIYLSDLIKDDFAYITFINAILSRGKNSPFWRETRDKYGDAYYTSSSIEKLSFDCGILTINTQTTSDNAERLTNSINKILSNKDYITKERFDNMVKYFDIHYKKLDQNRYINISTHINPEKWNMRKILKTISYDKVIEIFEKYYKVENFILSIDKEDFKAKL